MSKRRVYSDATLAIMDRFFLAMEECKRQKMFKITGYCEENGIYAPHFYMQRKDRNRGFFEVGWLNSLVEKYHISSYWLLTGMGQMFG